MSEFVSRRNDVNESMNEVLQLIDTLHERVLEGMSRPVDFDAMDADIERLKVLSDATYAENAYDCGDDEVVMSD
mgnify:CR=1 FL=1